jgi:phage gp29-like protein
VQLTTSIRCNGLLSSRVTFDGSGDRRRRKRVERALDTEDDFWSMFPEGEARQVLKWSLVLGFGSAYLDWRQLPGHGGRDIPVLQFFHPQQIVWDERLRSWMRTIEGSKPEPIVWGDSTWVGHMPEGSYKPVARGIWRGLARWVLLKAYAISDYGRAGEMASRNVVEIDKEVETRHKQRSELAEDISTMARDGAIVLPPGHRYKTVELSATTKDLFNQQIALANEGIAIAIRGGNLSTNVKDVGSKAAAETQERSGEALLRAADASAWEVTVHDQVLTPWAASNYGSGELAPWAVYETSIENKAAKAETMDRAMDGANKATNIGFQLDHEAFASEFGLEKFLKPPKPGSKPAHAEKEGDDADEEQPDETPTAPRVGKDRAKNTIRSLRFGASLRANSGFVDGQLFADALVESSLAESDEALRPTLEAVLEELEEAADYNDLRARLRARYADLSPTDLSDLCYRAMVLAELAGVASVNQDVS